MRIYERLVADHQHRLPAAVPVPLVARDGADAGMEVAGA